MRFQVLTLEILPRLLPEDDEKLWANKLDFELSNHRKVLNLTTAYPKAKKQQRLSLSVSIQSSCCKVRNRYTLQLLWYLVSNTCTWFKAIPSYLVRVHAARPCRMLIRFARNLNSCLIHTNTCMYAHVYSCLCRWSIFPLTFSAASC